MSAEAQAPVVCARCGSTRLRGSRPHGPVELLERRLRGLRFHVCKECGARGSHAGRRHGSGTVRTDSRGRPLERRDLRARRSRIFRRAWTVLAAILLGAWFGFYTWSCEAKRAEAPPPGAAVP